MAHLPPSYLSCGEALHAVRKECGVKGTPSYEACMLKKNVHLSSDEVHACGHAPTQCVVMGDSQHLFVCTRDASRHPQKVYGMPLRGTPMRVDRDPLE